MPMQITPAENRKLEALNLTYRTTALSRTADYRCQIIDKNSGRVVESAVNADQEQAVHDAIAKVTPGHRSMSQSEVVAENASLRAQLEAAGVKPEKDTVQADYESMPADQLRKELDARGIESPSGNARSAAWKTEAVALIHNHDAAD